MKKVLDNDKFVHVNLAEIVRKYAKQHIIICRGHIFTGVNAVKKARARFPKAVPMLFSVPAPEEFTHLL